MQAYHLRKAFSLTDSHQHADYDDIPGTFVFDWRQSRKGYALNMFCMSLNDPANREAFRANEATYVQRFAMNAEQVQAILERQWLRMLELGGNIYYTAKLAACDGLSFQQLAAKQTGVTEADWVAMMTGGGRSIDGNRSKHEPRWASQHDEAEQTRG
jgi:protocatechuate 4,5-dioxygenase, alpha chain